MGRHAMIGLQIYIMNWISVHADRRAANLPANSKLLGIFPLIAPKAQPVPLYTAPCTD